MPTELLDTDPEALPDAPRALPDDPEDLPDAGADPLKLAAWKASRLKADPTQALAASRATGYTPEFAASNAAELQQRATADKLNALPPALAGYAGQSGVHAAAVAQDADQLSWLEKHITGRWEMQPLGAGPYSLPTPPLPVLTEEPSWLRAIGESMREQRMVALGAKALVGELNPREEAEVEDLQAAAQAGEKARVEEGFVAKALLFPLRGSMYIGGLVGSGAAGGAAAGPAGAAVGPFLYNFAQNAGPLYLQLRDLKDEDGFVVLSDDQARMYAMLGADAAALLMELPALKFAQGLPGVKQMMGTAARDAIGTAMADAGLVKRLAQAGTEYGTHVVSGGLLMAAQSAANAATIEIARGGDPMNVARAARDSFVEGAVGSLALSAPGAISGFRRAQLAGLGRAAEARRDGTRLQAMVETAKGSKLAEASPPDFRDAVARMTDADGAADTVHIDREAWDKRFGDLAAQVHAQTVGDGGRGYAEAQATGAPVEVPLADHLAKLVPDGHAEALLPDSKLNPEGVTPREAAAGVQPEMPADVRATMEQEMRRDDYRDAARRTLADKPIGQIAPGRYEQAAQRAVERAIAFAAEHDKGADKIVDQYAKALGISQDAARQALMAARSGFMGAGLREGSDGAVGDTTLRAAGVEAKAAERTAAKANAAEERAQALQAEHGQALEERRQKLEELKAQKTMAEEMAKEATRVRVKMDKAFDKLSGRATDDKYRADLGMAGREYLDGFDAIAEAVGAAPASLGVERVPLDGVVQRLRADGVPPAFDVDAIRGLLDNPLPWKALTPKEANNVQAALKQLRHTALAQNELALGDRKLSLRRLVDEVQKYADDQKYPVAEPPAPSQAVEKPSTLVKLHVESLQPQTILRRMGPIGEAIYDAYVAARNGKEELARQIGEHIAKALQNLPAELKRTRFDGVEGPGSPVVNDNKWTRQDLWTLALWAGSESGMERAAGGLQIEPAKIHRALEQLTPKEAEFINSIWKLHDEKLWPLIKDHAERSTGIAPPKIAARPFEILNRDGERFQFDGGYWPAKYRKDVGAQSGAAVPEDISSQWGSLAPATEAVSRSFTNERAAHFADVPVLDWSAYPGHVNSVLHYLSFDDFVRTAGRVFRDKGFRDLVKTRLGTQEMAELDKFLTTVARGKVESPTGGAQTWNEVLGGGFRSRVATAAFQLNVPVVLRQLSHVFVASAGLRIGPADILVGLGKALTNSWADARGESAQLGYRWNGYGSKMREMLAGIGPADAPAGRKWLDAMGWSLYHGMDGFLSQVIFHAAKSKFNGDVHAADAAVSTAMPPLNIAEQSSVVRDRGMLGSILLVRNFPNTLYNVGAMNAWQARTGIWQANPGLARFGAAIGGGAAAAAAYLVMNWGTHIVGLFMGGQGPKEDQTTKEWLAIEGLVAPFYPLPFGEDIAAPLATAAVTDKTLKESIAQHDIRAAPALALLQGAIKDLSKLTDEGAEMPDRVTAAAKLAAAALRLPVYPIKPLRYGYDLLTGAQSPRGPLDVAGGFVYGQRDKQARNPFTAAQDLTQ